MRMLPSIAVPGDDHAAFARDRGKWQVCRDVQGHARRTHIHAGDQAAA